MSKVKEESRVFSKKNHIGWPLCPKCDHDLRSHSVGNPKSPISFFTARSLYCVFCAWEGYVKR